jgi:hypothetical protein
MSRLTAVRAIIGLLTLLLWPAVAGAACSTAPATLAALVSPGACLQSGTSTFSHWQVTVEGDSRFFNPAAVEVRPGTFGRGDGVQLQGGFTTESILDVTIQYAVSGPSAYVAALLYLVVGGGDPGRHAILVETVRPPGKQLIVSVGGRTSTLATFPAVSPLLVTTHVYLTCPEGVPCTVDVSEFQEDFLRVAQ